ncbi:MAG: S1 RNA-binding domain-containing protein [Acutalibacteraceae bacterium]|nr:S1 RNA-binding domain-containing protein [Acutalibacteraceae bacterium]
MVEFYPEGILINKAENIRAFRSLNSLNEAYLDGRILEARAIICDADHNLIVDMGCIKGLIPREEGALGIKEGKVRDIAVISRVNRPVSFIITDFIRSAGGSTMAVLSRSKAQEICMEKYISRLSSGDVINARITHLESFGAFADIGCGVISMIPIDTISVSRIEHPRERFAIGMDIKAVVRSIENGRVNLTHKELLGTWEENASAFKAGETVAGVVRSVEEYGAFVELTPNLAGLAEIKDGITSGSQASVYIKNIIPERMKIKLIIIDTFEQKYKPDTPKYFFTENHMDSFLYSPVNCEKTVETVFNCT